MLSWRVFGAQRVDVYIVVMVSPQGARTSMCFFCHSGQLRPDRYSELNAGRVLPIVKLVVTLLAARFCNLVEMTDVAAHALRMNSQRCRRLEFLAHEGDTRGERDYHAEFIDIRD